MARSYEVRMWRPDAGSGPFFAVDLPADVVAGSVITAGSRPVLAVSEVFADGVNVRDIRDWGHGVFVPRGKGRGIRAVGYRPITIHYGS